MRENGFDRYRLPWRMLTAVVLVGAVAWAIVLWRGPVLDSEARDSSPSAAERGDLSTGLTRYPPNERRPAPDIRGATLDGDRLALADLRGRVVVVNVWGSWCPPCREEAPDLARTARETTDRGVRFVGINVRDNPGAAGAFVRKFDIRYPSLVDTDGTLLLAFDGIIPVSAIPSTLVIDTKGRIAARVIGKTTYTTLLGLLEERSTRNHTDDMSSYASDPLDSQSPNLSDVSVWLTARHVAHG